MSEYLYFIFQIHNPKSKLIREFKNVIQCSEETLVYELTTLNRMFIPSSVLKIEKIRLSDNTTFDFVYRPNPQLHKHECYFEARRMILECS